MDSVSLMDWKPSVMNQMEYNISVEKYKHSSLEVKQIIYSQIGIFGQWDN